MVQLSVNEIEEINEEIFNRIPGAKIVKHYQVSSINLLVARHYMEAYECYQKYVVLAGQVEQEEALKFTYIVVTGLLRMASYKEAKKVLMQAKKIYRGNEFILNNLAVVLVKLHEYESALAILEEGLTLQEKNEKMKRNYEKLKSFLRS